MNTATKVTNYCKAGYSGLYIVSHEETRVQAEVKAACESIGYKLHCWTLTQGISVIDGAETAVIPDTQDPVAAMDAFMSLPEKSLLLLLDFHAMFTDPNPMLVRKVKDALAVGRANSKTLVLVGPVVKVPIEIEKLVTVIEFTLPDRETLDSILSSIADSAKVAVNGNRDAILDAAAGLTTSEAEDAFALSVVEEHDFVPAVVFREKSNTVKKNGMLEILEPKTTLGDIGGLENLKDHLNSIKGLFGKAARDYGLPTPRGIITVGQPGTGKSLTATATAAVFGIPLLRLEAGRLFGSLVGQSESNWRTTFATARAMRPCILWIDEVDGLFSGMGSSGGSTDGGTTQRVLKAILQDMQMAGDGIFFMFTANDVDCLPDPLIDRLDVWSVDLPNAEERAAIWRIHIRKPRENSPGRNPVKFDLGALATATDGFSGRQIEQVWLKAMTVAFNAGRETKTDDALAVCKATVPTSKLMAEQIERRRKRLANRAQCATREPEKANTTGPRKITAQK